MTEHVKSPARVEAKARQTSIDNMALRFEYICFGHTAHFPSDYRDRCKRAAEDAHRELAASPPAEALHSQTSGAEGISTHQAWLERVADRALQLGRRPTRAEILMCASDWAALAKPASEPAGGEVTLTRQQIDSMLRAAYPLATASERAGVLAAALSSPASSSPAEAEALQAGVGVEHAR